MDQRRRVARRGADAGGHPHARPVRPARSRARRGRGRGSRGRWRGLAPGQTGQDARRPAPARARDQRAQELRDPPRRGPRAEDGRGPGAGQESGRQVHRGDQDRPRRARPFPRDADRPEPARNPRARRGEMRHGKAGFKLGRVTAHRWALFRNLLVALFRHERIMTTEAKAKAVRGLADQMVTLAKRESLHARRQVLSMVPDDEVVRRLFDTIAARFGDRQGGYTRIIRIGPRPGDAAPMVLLELVDRPDTPAEKDGKKGDQGKKSKRGEAGAGEKRERRKKAAAAAG